MRPSLHIIFFFLSVMLAATAAPFAFSAAANLNFTGKFVHRGDKINSDLDPEVTLDVVQNDQTVEVTRDGPAGKMSNRYLLNGSEQDCVTSNRVSAKCKAQLKGKYLALESVVDSPEQNSGSVIHVRTLEQWQLSGDSKTLTIKLRVDFPGAQSGMSSNEGQSVEEDKFIRESTH
jgi:type 1 fimbria pilin